MSKKRGERQGRNKVIYDQAFPYDNCSFSPADRRSFLLKLTASKSSAIKSLRILYPHIPSDILVLN